MTINEFIEIIKTNNYVDNSLILKSQDNYACVYKYLEKNRFGYAERKEIFIELNPEQNELELLNKTVISYIEIYPAL